MTIQYREQALIARKLKFCARIDYRCPWRLEFLVFVSLGVFSLFNLLAFTWSFPDYRSFPANIVAAQPAIEIRSETDAYISDLSIRAGDRVEQGQVVAELKSWERGALGPSWVVEQQQVLIDEIYNALAQLELQSQRRLARWRSLDDRLQRLAAGIDDLNRLRELRIDEYQRATRRDRNLGRVDDNTAGVF